MGAFAFTPLISRLSSLPPTAEILSGQFMMFMNEFPFSINGGDGFHHNPRTLLISLSLTRRRTAQISDGDRAVRVARRRHIPVAAVPTALPGLRPAATALAAHGPRAIVAAAIARADAGGAVPVPTGHPGSDRPRPEDDRQAARGVAQELAAAG